jgi:hypothetical protein
MDLDELAGHQTLPKDERELVAGKRADPAGFALLLVQRRTAARVPE